MGVLITRRSRVRIPTPLLGKARKRGPFCIEGPAVKGEPGVRCGANSSGLCAGAVLATVSLESMSTRLLTAAEGAELPGVPASSRYGASGHVPQRRAAIRLETDLLSAPRKNRGLPIVSSMWERLRHRFSDPCGPRRGGGHGPGGGSLAHTSTPGRRPRAGQHRPRRVSCPPGARRRPPESRQTRSCWSRR
jgi:hypothetical protein